MLIPRPLSAEIQVQVRLCSVPPDVLDSRRMTSSTTSHQYVDLEVLCSLLPCRASEQMNEYLWEAQNAALLNSPDAPGTTAILGIEGRVHLWRSLGRPAELIPALLM